MGQYYKALTVDTETRSKVTSFATSWNYNNGAKLMEHSYIQNNFVEAFETTLINNPQVVVWAGDYADAEVDADGNDIQEPGEGSYADRMFDVNLYGMCKDKEELKRGDVCVALPIIENKIKHTHRYIINHDTKQFVDKKDFKESSNWQIHPLPLLTADGNNRGGGDFREGNPGFDQVGIWKRNLISVTSRKTNIPKGFTQLKVDFREI